MSDIYHYYALSVLASSLGFLYYVYVNSIRYKLSHIPTIGHSAPLLTYISAWRYFWDPTYVYDTIEEGYRKHPHKVFKVPTLTSWEVIVNGTQAVEEMCRAPVEVVSNSLAFSEFLQLDYTLGRGVTQHPYHVTVVRGPITRNIAAKFDKVRDEVVRGYAEALEGLRRQGQEEWVRVPVYDVTIKLVAKILAKVSVGYPLCDNEEFVALCGRAVRTLIKGRNLRLFPKVLRPLASRLLINVQKDLRRMAVLLEPVVRDRLEQEEEAAGSSGAEGGEWSGKPNDVLQWLMDEARRIGIERTPLDLATRIYFLSFASEDIAVALTNALRIIASHPPEMYLFPLRAELERVLNVDVDADADVNPDVGGNGYGKGREVDVEGQTNGKGIGTGGDVDGEGQGEEQGVWTKNAVGRMYLLDSFLREVQRCFDIQPLHVSRRTVQPFVFSDGTVIPPGVTMYANSHAMYRDEARFEGARRFEGFRYVMPAEGEECRAGVEVGVGVNGNGNGNGKGNGDGNDHSARNDALPTGSFKQPLLAKPAPDYHAFGFGKHACPGRFSATYQLKTMLAHVLMVYDVSHSEEKPTTKPNRDLHSSSMGDGNRNGNGKTHAGREGDGFVRLRLAGEKIVGDGGGEDEGAGSKAGQGVATKLWFRRRR